MIVDVGKKRIGDLLIPDFKYIGVGDGGDDTSTAQTTLDNEISGTRKEATVARQGNTLVYEVTFSGSELTSNIINELGIFNAATNGTLLTRVNFKAIGPLGSSDSVAFTFRLVME